MFYSLLLIAGISDPSGQLRGVVLAFACTLALYQPGALAAACFATKELSASVVIFFHIVADHRFCRQH
jgi:hypothetical protein